VRKGGLEPPRDCSPPAPQARGNRNRTQPIPENWGRLLCLCADWCRSQPSVTHGLQILACAGKTGGVLWMKEPDGEGLASPTDSGDPVVALACPKAAS